MFVNSRQKLHGVKEFYLIILLIILNLYTMLIFFIILLFHLLLSKYICFEKFDHESLNDFLKDENISYKFYHMANNESSLHKTCIKNNLHYFTNEQKSSQTA